MNKVLVSYFSASGVTEEVGNRISEIIHADVFNIEPVEKYSEADLNWRDNQSRSSKEMADKEARPEIKDRVTNFQDYDTILLGFPVWWDVAPRIINTFIESYDFTNKNVYVFVTSGSSTYNNSLLDLREKYPNINFVKGIRLNTNFREEEVNNWLK